MLKLVTADRSAQGSVELRVTVNGTAYTVTLPEGYGLQAEHPVHLAQPAAADFSIPAEAMINGRNVVTIEVVGEDWVTWDAIVAVAQSQP